MSLDNLFAQLDSQLSGDEKSTPPVHLWSPEYCGEIDLVIKANGDWYYNSTPFKRLRLVKLFASVLKCEQTENGDDEYFLVTPVEKIKISVEDAPFLITRWQWQDEKPHSTMLLATNLGDELTLNEQHPLTVTDNGDFYVNVRANLKAKVHRNVYYQWIEQAKEVQRGDTTEWFIESDNQSFVLGQASD